MFFKILGYKKSPPESSRSKAYLQSDNWNDYAFLTLFALIYFDGDGNKHEIGAVKIGCFGQAKHEQKLLVGYQFDTLDDEFFSLGQDDSYYEKLNSLGGELRDKIFSALNDIAKFSDIYDQCISEVCSR